mgnify:CR=1 FL=1
MQNNKGYKRTERVNSTLQRAVSEVLSQGVSDPALSAVIVMGVDVSPDLKNATVYWYLAKENDEERVATAKKALSRAVGRIRNQVASSVRMKVVPRLRFKYDDDINTRRHIESLLDGLVPSDEESVD